MIRNRWRWMLALSAIAVAFVFIAADFADARSRTSFGSRGTRTFSAPPATKTAPTTRPMERTMTQPSKANPSTNLATRPALQNSPAAGLMNRPGFMGGLFAGLLGAGLIGLLLGTGLAGGLGGLASFLGLALQIGIIVLIGWLLWSWWQRRSQPQTAMGPALRDLPGNGRQHHAYSAGGTGGALGGGLGSGLGGYRAPASDPDEIGTTPADFEAFERLLGEIQTAYGAEDLARLRRLVTPEMLSYYSEALAANASRGIVNRIRDVKLLQGDPAEAWREGDTEYCTVAMRYSLTDEIVDRATDRVIEGGPDEATEVWTFMRVRGGNWILSAVQQTD
jgi:predicted lipid-binding transport protein (Tim44 family)